MIFESGLWFFEQFQIFKKFKFFTTCTTRTRCVCSHRPDCEEDADEATGAESSSDEGEDAGPESSSDETDEEAAGSSDEEEEVAPPASSSGCPRGRRMRAPKKKSLVDEVGGEWKKEDNTPIDIP